MFTLCFCIDVVDSFRSVSLQELQATLYEDTIFSDEGDGIQDLVYLKIVFYFHDKRNVPIMKKDLKFVLKYCSNVRKQSVSFNLKRLKSFEQFLREI